MQVIIVLAGDHNQFLQWCEEQHRSPHDCNVIYASSDAHLQGIHGANYVIVGTFWERSDADALYFTAQTAELP